MDILDYASLCYIIDIVRELFARKVAWAQFCGVLIYSEKVMVWDFELFFNFKLS